MELLTVNTPRGPRTLGPGHPTFIIAELSGNHSHSFERAQALVEAAIESGADAVKLQTYTPDTLTLDCERPEYQVEVNDSWKGQTLYQLYQKAYTPWEWHAPLKKHAEERGVLLFSSPFDETAVDYLEDLDVALYKVASLEIGWVQLLRKIGTTKKPVIVSRGLAPPEEIHQAIQTLKDAGAPAVAILHCISSYPATLDQMNLRTIPDIQRRFDVVSGLSDHSLHPLVPALAVAQGACIVEKHFTLSRQEPGPDVEFSLEPHEFRAMVDSIREAERALGKVQYDIEKKEAENLIFKRSIVAFRDIEVGEALSEENVRVLRPGFGLAPKEWDKLMGRQATKKIERGAPIQWDLVAP